MLEVYKDVKYGEEVFVSKTAEEGRKNGCLCINGCKRFKNNLAWQTEQERKMLHTYSTETPLSEEVIREALRRKIIDFAAEWFKLTDAEREKRLENMKEGDFCPLAMVNYAWCLTGCTSDGVDGCPYFLPDETRVPLIKNPKDGATT